MVEYDDKTLMFTGFIDAIFQHDSGYLIVDYKTNKNKNNSSDHKKQLTVYRKMHSILENIAEDKIKIFVVFVALRGGINTGKFDWAIEKESRNAFPTFEKHLRKVLAWKQIQKNSLKTSWINLRTIYYTRPSKRNCYKSKTRIIGENRLRAEN